MDDMKKLIERYKRELMEYSKASAPKERLEFPEMLEEPQENAEGQKHETAVIGYVSDEAGDTISDYSKLFEELAADSGLAERENSSPAYDGEESGDGFFSSPQMPAEETENTLSDSDSPPPMWEQDSQPPYYDDIPSFEQTREDITRQSIPQDNYPPPSELSDIADNSPAEPRPDFAAADSVAPEAAKRLSEEPISGRNANERLTGRSFQDETITGDYPKEIYEQGSGVGLSDSGERPFASYADFERYNPNRGTIRFFVYTARGAIPIKGAVCVISKSFGGSPYEILRLTTDESGQTAIKPLPAPPRELSQSPDSSVLPYSMYDAHISADGYTDITLRNIPIFDGIQSIQRAAMVPEGGAQPDEIITQSEPDLNGGE